MASEKTNITEAVTHVAAVEGRQVVQAMAMVNANNSQRIQNEVSKIGGTIMKQPTFDC